MVAIAIMFAWRITFSAVRCHACQNHLQKLPPGGGHDIAMRAAMWFIWLTCSLVLHSASAVFVAATSAPLFQDLGESLMLAVHWSVTLLSCIASGLLIPHLGSRVALAVGSRPEDLISMANFL
eukprot:750021-Amphidinium_carterae.1